MNISPAGSRPSVRRQTSRLFVLIIEQPPTAHLNSLSRSSRVSFQPLLGMSHFYDHHFGSHRPSPSTVKPSLASKSAALIKIASFVALSIPLSSYPWWHNGAGNFPLQSWFRRTSTWNNGGVLLYDELARWVSSISFYLLIFFLWLSEQRKIRKVRSRGYIDKKSQDNRNVKYATEINEAKSAWGTFSIRTSFPCLQGQSFLRKQRFLKPNQWLIQAVFPQYCWGTDFVAID